MINNILSLTVSTFYLMHLLLILPLYMSLIFESWMYKGRDRLVLDISPKGGARTSIFIDGMSLYD